MPSRRQTLSFCGVILTGFTGCSSTDVQEGTPNVTPTESPVNVPEGGYEECDWIAIGYGSFPDPIRREIDAALETGTYETHGGLLLVDAIAIDESYVVVDDVPYKPMVSRDGGRTILELVQSAEIRLPEPLHIRMENSDEIAHELHVRLESESDRLVDETVHVEPSETKKIGGVGVFGRYSLWVEALTGHGDVDSAEFIVDNFHLDGNVRIDADGVRVGQIVVERPPCPWDRNYQ